MIEQATLTLIARSYLKIALSSFGGGLSAWTQQIVVEERRWIDDREFLSGLALSRMLPGPTMVNFAVFLGSRLRGFPGVVAALTGLLVDPFIGAVFLGMLYFEYQHIPKVQPALAGMAAAAAGMSIGMGLKMLMRRPGNLAELLIVVAAFLLIGVMRVPLLLSLLILVPCALLLFRGETK